MAAAWIVSSCRTAIGELGGSLAAVTAVDLGARVISEAITRAGLAPGDIEETYLGNVVGAGTGLCAARQSALAAGVPARSPAVTVDMVCASGLKAVSLAASDIQAGRRGIVIAGGTESTSCAPHLARVRAGKKLGTMAMEDAVLVDGLQCPMGDEHMGMTAERVAAEKAITREDADGFSLQSHQRAVAARQAFSREIVAVEIPRRKGEALVFQTDERVREDTSLDKLGALKPAFTETGVVTAGNSSGINDGAAALVVASEDAVDKRGLTPVARITGWATAGVEPGRMGMGPVPATRILCDDLGMKPSEFDLVELNEAFACQALAVIGELGLDESRVNIRGGAVALGHPLGCTGARILVTLLHAMEDTGAKTGLATLCVGTGMGMSLAVERAWSVPTSRG